MQKIVPEKLKAGDEVMIVAPSRGVKLIGRDVRELAEQRLGKMGLKVRYASNATEENFDMLATTSAEKRAADIMEAFLDKRVKAVMTIIGGFNTNQILPYLDYEVIKKNPKILCGFSDITALLDAVGGAIKHVDLVQSVLPREYRADRSAPYLPSAWDNRFVVNVSGTWDLPRSWSVGMRLSAVGGSPYTPYDEEKSSLVEAWDAQGRPYYDYTQYNARRLDAFAQLDVRVDKTFYFRRCMLGFYIDLQNVTVSKLRQPDVLMSTGVVENPEAPLAEQRYRMKRIAQVSGTLLPTLGITVEF